MDDRTEPIAIIGMAGRFPGSVSLKQFWTHLESKRDLITELPKNRWNDPAVDMELPGLKYGGFIEDVERFDAAFFGISPKEAEAMDPQHRLMLEAVWATVEDAGYRISELAKTKTGIFIGVSTNDYIEVIRDSGMPISPYQSTGNSYCILANRISYLFDLMGPSEPINTACSSSLIALHRAVEAIRSHSATMAIVGGINLILHPMLTIAFSKAGMLSADGRCKTFDKQANGYVRGEGLGSVFLKPLRQAEKDGDHIYGVILGSAENHGGKASSLTAPNTKAQTELILAAYSRAGVDLSTITYMEMHGTGTALGDPVEFNGLKNAYQQKAILSSACLTPKCALGSVKTNIGHLEAAAGMAGLIKILLAFEHKKIPGIVHLKELNPYIKREDTHFYFPTDSIFWGCSEDQNRNPLPRRAGISSFGFGGANAHVVLEEYRAEDQEHTFSTDAVFPLFLLSAKDELTLNKSVRRYKSYIEENIKDEHLFLRMLYTLQVGREAMSCRLAIHCHNRDELLAELDHYLSNRTSEKLFTHIIENASSKKSMRDFLQKQPKELAHEWVQGGDIDWKKYYINSRIRRMSLPTYPFADTKFWVKPPPLSDLKFPVAQQLIRALPLIHIENSQGEEADFQISLSGDEYILRDHLFFKNKILPGVAYLEIIYQAVFQKYGRHPKKLQNFKWHIPFIYTPRKTTLYISLIGKEDELKAELWSPPIAKKGAKVVHCTSTVSFAGDSDSDADFKNSLEDPDSVISSNELYTHFAMIGFQYGASFQTISQIERKGNELIVQLALPSRYRMDATSLPISVIDGALQSVIAFAMNREDVSGSPSFLPSHFESLTLFTNIPAEFRAYVKKSEDSSDIYAIALFDKAGQKIAQIEKFHAKSVAQNPSQEKKPFSPPPSPSIDGMRNEIIVFLKEMIANESHVPIDQLNEGHGLDRYGFDSFMAISLNTQLEKKFGKLPKTLFFEYQTIRELADYFLQNHFEQFKTLSQKPQFDPFSRNNAVAKSVKPPIPQPAAIKNDKRDIAKTGSDIAIIGLSGRYPKANDIYQFWKILKEGLCSITEIPLERWPYRLYYSDQKHVYGKIYSKWGGFIDDIDKFDPLFFNISHEEAKFMDPQERLFLETVWGAIEDAGYNPDEFSDFHHRNVGVYVGVTNTEYELLATEQTLLGNPQIVSGISANVANRTSYFFNFKGPSIALNTMCSSSLTTLHLACESLKNGETQVAIAGGVNISIHPNKFVGLSLGTFLSSEGLCKSFGEGGDGYVPAEGVGAVILKPLELAMRDKDHIYGVIKGSAINHGGKVNGYTVPNPNAQADVIKHALNNSGVPAETIGYIEAHGTGTALGDPIEIAGLTKAYTPLTDQKQICRIGSVKSNIGHCEASAGIAAITKVLLQMKYQQLVPTLHANPCNPLIDFSSTPFRIQHDLEKWSRAKINKGGEWQEVPLRAAISSFGAGGSNAHVVLEEHIDRMPPSEPASQQLFILSAKNELLLKEYAEKMVQFFESEEKVNSDALAYTLQVGRKQFTTRLAILFTNLSDLKHKLYGYLNKIPDPHILISGSKTEEELNFYSEPDALSLLKRWFENKQYRHLAEAWVNGAAIPWAALCEGRHFHRASLPTSPFEKERIWIDTGKDRAAGIGKSEALAEINRKQDTPFSGKQILKESIARTASIPLKALSDETTFDEIGLNSILIQQIIIDLSKSLGEIDPATFFKYRNISEYGSFLESLTPVKDKENARTVERTSIPVRSANSDVAIIGMSGRYPKAKNLDEFWANLLSARDCIEEIPSTRWDYRKFWSEEKGVYGKLYCKWGGFLENIDEFDPLFFNISPQDARYMDPNERLFLEECWKCLESAGYGKEAIKEFDPNRKIGVFAGVTYNNYQLFLAEQLGKETGYPANSQIFSIANRVSYAFDFRAASIAVDTACSSSLYAIHMAYEHVKSGACRMALAGGVNLSLHPSKYITLCMAGFAASDGRCRSFGEGGTGYVPGEGVGVVLLKRLDDAIRDKDTILGVIKGTGVTHCGKTNGYTVPNSVSQADAIDEALRIASVPPSSVSYVEAHGTGTPLGDPIEIDGLTTAFNRETQSKQYCALSSVKSNIGHLEAAAGIAQLTKVLLQLKHKTLVPNLIHSDRINTKLKLEQTPFYILQNVQEWRKPTDYPRRAGISSFGAGGVNVHLIVEEFLPEHRPEFKEEGAELILLSAKNHTDLIQKAKDLCLHLTHLDKHNAHLADISFTLAMGRDHLACRYAAVAESQPRLIQLLNSFINGGLEDESRLFYYGDLNRQFVKLPKNKRATELDSVAERWIAGEKVSLHQLYRERKVKRIPLPTYPFSKQRYWITDWIAEASPPSDNRQLEAAKIEQPKLPLLSPQLQELAKLSEVEQLEYLQSYLQKLVRNILGFPPGMEVDIHQGLHEMGMESMQALQVQNQLEKEFLVKVPDTAAFDYPNIAKFSPYFLSLIQIPLTADRDDKIPITKEEGRKFDKEARESDAIAIIGMSCRLPGGVRTPDDYWKLLIEGREGLSLPPPERWSVEKYYDPNPDVPEKMYVKESNFLRDSIREFDAKLFGISPREAEEIDPQHRLLLELSWEALENASIRPDALIGSKTGVFIGIGGSEYAFLVRDTQHISPYSLTGTTAHMASGRISHLFGLHGPSMSIDTACSSSLVSLHEACKSLQVGESSLAIVGGVNLMVNPEIMVSLCQLKALSKDGRCKAFDAAGDGYGRSEGGGVVILKRLQDAKRDGDNILAVIKGSAVNHDGPSSGLTVPNVHAQIDVIKSALQNSKVTPDEVSYIEAHGTGTALGDPIEIQALQNVYGQRKKELPPIFLGTSKANLGHLEAAAGIVGLLKIVLCIQNRSIPPHINFKNLNPRIVLENIPATLPFTQKVWEGQTPLTAGVSSFGFSGTNAHVIVQELMRHPKERMIATRDPDCIYFVLSAKTKKSLELQTQNLLHYLRTTTADSASLWDLQMNLLLGRNHFKHRILLTGRDRAELVQRLSDYIEKKEHAGIRYTDSSQKVKNTLFITDNLYEIQAVRDMYRTHTVFKTKFEECADLVYRELNYQARNLLNGLTNSDSSALEKSLFSFCCNYAFIHLLEELGWPLHSFSGINSGFLLALVFCGTLSLEQAVRLIKPSQINVLRETLAAIQPQKQKYRMVDCANGNSLQFTQASAEKLVSEWAIGSNLSNQLPKILERFKGDLCLSDLPGMALNLLRELLGFYANGMNFNWHVLFPEKDWNSLPLPTYPFDRSVHWIEHTKRATSQTTIASEAVQSENPLLGSLLLSPLKTQQCRFTITHQNLPEIADTHHVLHVGFIQEMILNSASKSLKINRHELAIRDLEFLRAMYVHQSPYHVYATLELQGDGSVAVQLMTQDSQGEWVLHVKCLVEKRQATDVSSLPSLESFEYSKLNSTQPIGKAEFYRLMQSKGISLGPSVKWVENAWTSGPLVLAELSLEGSQELKPGIFDAIAQLLHLFLQAEEGHVKLMATSVGKEMYLNSAAKGPFYVAMKQLPGQGRTVDCDVFLYDVNQKLIFYGKKLSATRLDASSPEKNHSEDDIAVLNQIFSTSDAEERKGHLVTYIKNVLSQLLKILPDELSEEEKLYSLGFDSLVGMKFKSTLDSALKCSLDMEMLFQNPSIGEMAEILANRLDPASKPKVAEREKKHSHAWFKEPIRNNGLLNLFCFPFGGGGASEYLSWVPKCSTSINVIPIQLPGHEERIDEPSETNLQNLTTRLYAEIKDYLRLPFAFYGHSLGALIALKLTLFLRENGEPPPAHLFVGAYSSPLHMPNPWLKVLKSKLGHLGIHSLSEINLTDTQALAATMPSITPDYEEFSQIDTQFAQRMFRVMLADAQLVESFHFDHIQPLSVPITAFSGKRDERVTHSEMESWKYFTVKDFNHHVMEGDHFFLKPNQQKETLINIIINTIKDAR